MASFTREMRKQSRRSKQQQAVDMKAADDDQYFWNAVQRGGANVRRDTKEQLFARQGASGINFAQYDSIPVDRSGPDTGHIPQLENFALLKTVLPGFLSLNLTASDRMNYSVPTPIQRHCVPLSLEGSFDVMACAQTGSGKTVAFLVPLIAAIHSAAGHEKQKKYRSTLTTPAQPLSLIIAPTRELASQIELEAHKLCFGSAIRCVCVYGGAPTRDQLSSLARGVDMLVATPGRLNDFLSRELISLERVRFLVLDEADRMLDMGFEPQIRQICDQYNLPASSNRRTLMFSATFPEAMQRIAQKYMRSYCFVAVGRVGSTTESITQVVVKAERNDKRLKLSLLVQLLQKLLDPATGKPPKTIVFTQKKHVASWVRGQIVREFPALSSEAIHGDRTQQQREAALGKFRDNLCDVLVATDVAARGLDVADVQQVIQFDLPVSKDDFDSYVHRIGRTGRAGNKGVATAFFVPGSDAKMGENGAIYAPLMNLLSEAKQNIPDWFKSLQGRGGGGSGGGGVTAGTGGTGSRGNAPTRDVRGGQQRTAFREETGDTAPATGQRRQQQQQRKQQREPLQQQQQQEQQQQEQQQQRAMKRTLPETSANESAPQPKRDGGGRRGKGRSSAPSGSSGPSGPSGRVVTATASSFSSVNMPPSGARASTAVAASAAPTTTSGAGGAEGGGGGGGGNRRRRRGGRGGGGGGKVPLA